MIALPAQLRTPALHSLYCTTLVGLIALLLVSSPLLHAQYNVREVSGARDVIFATQSGFTEVDEAVVHNTDSNADSKADSKHGKVFFTARTSAITLFVREAGLSFVQTLGLRQHRTDIEFGSRLSNVRGNQLLSGITRRYTSSGSGKPMSSYNQVQCNVGTTTITIGLNGSAFYLNSSSDIMMTIVGSDVSVHKNNNESLFSLSSLSIPISLTPFSQTVAHIESSTPHQNSLSEKVSVISLKANTRINSHVGFEITTPTTSSSYYGGSALDSASTSVGDGTSLYVCGVTTSTNFPTTPGTFQQTSQGNRDAFIVKFDSRGNRIWSSYYGGSDNDIATGIALLGNTIAICGTTNTKSNFIQGNGYKSTYLGGSTDGFLSTFNSTSGQIQNSTYVGGNSIDACTDVCFLPNGNIACTGTTFSDNLEANRHQKIQGGISDVFVCVLSPTLSALEWSTYYGSDDLEYGGGITSSSDGSLYICGTTGSFNANNIISTSNIEGNNLVEFFDCFIAKFSSQGVREWGRYYGGKGYDYATRITLSSSLVMIVGYTNTGTTPERFMATADGAQTDYGGGINDGFIASFDIQSGSRIWGTYQGGSGDDRCTGITTTPNGDVFVTGMSNSTNFPLTPKDSPTPKGGYDAFLGYYKANGKLRIASVLFGGSGDDRGVGLMRLNDNTVLLCGTTTSNNLPVSGSGQLNNAGGSDIFLASFIDYSILDVDETSETSGISIAPNPTLDILQVSYNSNAENIINTTVYSMLGIPVLSLGESDGESIKTIDVSTLQTGAYIVRFRTASKRVISIPFIKQ